MALLPERPGSNELPEWATPSPAELFVASQPERRFRRHSLTSIMLAAERFGGGEITFVGGRGMIKGPQINALHEEGFHFITAITKQMSLFDAPLAEVTTTEGQRYILRRNPERAKEIASSRESKYGALNTAMVTANDIWRPIPAPTLAPSSRT